MHKYFTILISLLLFFSCNKNLELDNFELQDQSQMFKENNFAVISEKYITTLDIPDAKGIAVERLRQGEIYEIQETRITKDKDSHQEFWVKINGGWVLSVSVQLYDSFDKAKTASKTLMENN